MDYTGPPARKKYAVNMSSTATTTAIPAASQRMCSTLEETLRMCAMEPEKLGAVDVTLICSDGKRIPANSTVLTGRSKYFHNLLEGPFLEGAINEVSIPYPKDVMIQIIQFLWTDKADIFDDDYDHQDKGFAGTIVSLIKAADEFRLEPLFEKARGAVLEIVEKKKPSHLVKCIVNLDEPLFKQVALHAIRKDPTLLLREEYLRLIDKSKMELVLGDKWIKATEENLFEILLMWSKLSEVSEEHKEQAAELIHHVTLWRIRPEYLCTTVEESGLATTQLCQVYKTQLLLATGPEPYPTHLKLWYDYTRAPHCWASNDSLVWTADPTDGHNRSMIWVTGAGLKIGIHKWFVKVVKMDGNTRLGVQVPLHLEDDHTMRSGKNYPYWLYSSTGRVCYLHKGDKVEEEEEHREFHSGSTVNFELDLSVDNGGILRASVDDHPQEVLFSDMLSGYDDRGSVGFLPAASACRGDTVQFLGYSEE